MKMKKCLILSILALISGCSDSSKISTPIDKPVTEKVQAQKTKEKETLYKRMLPGGSWAWMKEPPPPDSNEPVITYEMVRTEEMAQAQKYKEEEDKLNEKLKSLLPSRETYGQFYSDVVGNQQIYQQGLSEDNWQYAYKQIPHWILENSRGEFIRLEDKSLWEVSPIDRIDSILWIPTSEITVIESRNPLYPYILINTNDGEKVEARLLAGSPMQSSALSGPTNLSSDLIESRIDGDFEGWDGDTVFKLTNGQIWQQVSYDYTYHYAFMPEVLIFKTTEGYKMKVGGIHETIYVKRLK
jgi:hypothetical protein